MSAGKRLWMLTAVLFTVSSLRAQVSGNKLFLRYPVALTPASKAVPPVLDTRDKRLFRTRIRQGAAKGAVFADHYAVATWGCGTSCLQFAIIDVRTGSVYLFPSTVSMDREEGELLTYHRASRAMHIIGSLNEKDSADRWYVWNGHALTLISTQPAKLMPNDIQ